MRYDKKQTRTGKGATVFLHYTYFYIYILLLEGPSRLTVAKVYIILYYTNYSYSVNIIYE